MANDDVKLPANWLAMTRFTGDTIRVLSTVACIALLTFALYAHEHGLFSELTWMPCILAWSGIAVFVLSFGCTDRWVRK